ncbi:MAG: MMPL family transporter [Oscillospiraceae bacterium]|nr:MMPL family transporter [Oscillospiraceae bacterium]
MKRVGKPVFFIVVILIALLTYLSFFGITTTFGDEKTTIIKGGQDIRWGIDIRGGVDVTFCPPEGFDATDEQMSAAESVIKTRLVTQNITDYEVYTDLNKDRIIVRFPWKVDEKDFDPEKAIQELGETAMLTFREGIEVDAAGLPTGVTAEKIILEGSDVRSAAPAFGDERGTSIVVSLELEDSGVDKFSEATGRLAGTNVPISIWMDDTCISYPTVSTQITDGRAVIEGQFTLEQATDLANKINGGALPFKLVTENYNSLSPTLGVGAKDAMVMAGFIAFALVAVLMIVYYRLPGLVAVIALAGQAAGTIACISGFAPTIPSFTLTLPGIAGIILAIGIGVDANIITTERIKEELKAGKSLDYAIDVGFQRAWSAIFDGNITVIFVAIILMGAFGPTSSFFSKMLSPIFFMFGQSTAGTVYSFGYTLLVGVILNFLMGVTASRLMLKSLSKFKAFRNLWLYGGVK